MAFGDWINKLKLKRSIMEGTILEFSPNDKVVVLASTILDDIQYLYVCAITNDEKKVKNEYDILRIDCSDGTLESVDNERLLSVLLFRFENIAKTRNYQNAILNESNFLGGIRCLQDCISGFDKNNVNIENNKNDNMKVTNVKKDIDEQKFYVLTLRNNFYCYKDNNGEAFFCGDMFGITNKMSYIPIYGMIRNGKMIDIITGETIISKENTPYLSYCEVREVPKIEVIDKISRLTEDNIKSYKESMERVRRSTIEKYKKYVECCNKQKQEEQYEREHKKQVDNIMNQDFDSYITRFRKKNR